MCGGERTRANNVSDKKGFNMVLTDVSLFIPPVDRARCFFELGALCWLGALELGASSQVLNSASNRVLHSARCYCVQIGARCFQSSPQQC